MLWYINAIDFVQLSAVSYIYILHLVIWQTLLSKATYNWGVHKAIHLEEAIRQDRGSARNAKSQSLFK